jgi:hypothetical protein
MSALPRKFPQHSGYQFPPVVLVTDRRERRIHRSSTGRPDKPRKLRRGGECGCFGGRGWPVSALALTLKRCSMGKGAVGLERKADFIPCNTGHHSGASPPKVDCVQVPHHPLSPVEEALHRRTL